MKKITDQIGELSAKQKQIAARLVNLKNRQDRIERAKETRRLILAGKWMFRLHKGDLKKVGERLQEAGLLAGRDKALFD